ncbi:thymidylate kinase-like [Chenopodium quinoa]|uniref:thymidylate kinase-like n=1 Tax=Chenopodium quinoa TaxID=63459 RepID=UPI000B79AC58|nr:thymidylate kinase-like [Chenopodium quinoa]
MTVKFTRAQRRNQDVKFQLNCSIFATKMENDSSKKIEVSSLNPNLQSRGALVVLEGLDRSRKSSQCIQLLSHLQSIGCSTKLWRFPDRNTAVGQMISTYLSNQSNLDDHTIHLLFGANRWEKISMMEEKLKTHLRVSVINQPVHSGISLFSRNMITILFVQAPEIGLLAPYMVLYLDISPEIKAYPNIFFFINAERGGYGDERYERLDFQGKVREKYQAPHDASWKVISIHDSLKTYSLQCLFCDFGKAVRLIGLTVVTLSCIVSLE